MIEWESQFWATALEVEPGCYRTLIDTTFALYRNWSPTQPPLDAIRTGWPYVARHATWYADSFSPTEEETFYAQHVAAWTPESPGPSNWSNWSGEHLPQGLLDSIRRLREQR